MRILIAGAGLSKGFGFPLTNEILGVGRDMMAYRISKSKEVYVSHLLEPFLTQAVAQEKGAGKLDFEALLSSIKDCVPGLTRDWVAKGGFDGGKLKDGGDPEFHHTMLVWAINEVLLEKADKTPSPNLWKRITNRGTLDAILSTNYDMVGEDHDPRDLFQKAPTDYGFGPGNSLLVNDQRPYPLPRKLGVFVAKFSGDQAPVSNGGLRIYKIHGSQNQAFCGKCGKVLVFPRSLKIMPGHPFHSPIKGFPPVPSFMGVQAWRSTTGYQSSYHCDVDFDDAPATHPWRLQPLIIPPVTNKRQMREWELLAPVRKAADDAVRECDSAIIVGSAIREADEDFIEMLKGLAGKPVEFVGAKDAHDRLARLAGVRSEYLGPRLEDL